MAKVFSSLAKYACLEQYFDGKSLQVGNYLCAVADDCLLISEVFCTCLKIRLVGQCFPERLARKSRRPFGHDWEMVRLI